MGSLRTLTRRRQRRAAKLRPRPAFYLIRSAEEQAAQAEALAQAYDYYEGKSGYENLQRPTGMRPYRG